MLLWAIATVLAATPPTAARLDLRSAYLVTDPGGRISSCDVLKFVDQGRTLLAAGDDKVVHSWTTGPESLTYDRPLRWNTLREARGLIYAMALSSNGRSVAVAGRGVRNADVTILDRAVGVKSVITSENRDYARADATVWALAFDLSGERIAIGQDDGSVWIWTPALNAVRLVVRPVDAKSAIGPISRVVWVRFTDDGRAVRFARRDGIVAEVIPGREPRELFHFGNAPISVAEASPDGSSLAATPLEDLPEGNRIEVRSLVGLESRILTYPAPPAPAPVPFPESLAWSADGKRLAVGLRLNPRNRTFNHPPAGQVRVYDLADKGNNAAASLTLPAYPEAIAFHPDGERIAIAFGHDGETALYKITGDKLVRLDVSKGVGQSVWEIAVARDGSRFQFRNQAAANPTDVNRRGAGEWRGFDLTKREWVPGVEPVPANRLNPDWRVVFDPQHEKKWLVVSTDGKVEHKLPLTANDSGPTCYQFLPPLAKGGPPRLAVGHYYGFSVFALDRLTGPQLVQRCVGHAGQVTCLDATPDGKTVVTGGRDQMVCLWDLGPWPSHPTLGAAFVQRGGELVVEKVDAGSPAWDIGLNPGDVVTGLGYDDTADVPKAQWARVLPRVQPGKRLEIRVLRGTGKHVGFTTMPTRPVARFFATRTDEWVLYRYQDGLYDASANGDRFVGWLVNGATAADAPTFSKVERFRAALHKPEQLAKFLAAPDRRAAQFAEIYPPPKVEVAVSQPQVAAGGGVTVTVTAVPTSNAAGNPQPIQKLDLWLDDQVLLATGPGVAVAGRADGAVSLTYQLTAAQLRRGVNRMVGVAHGMSRGEATAALELAAAPADPNRKPALYALLVGVDHYNQLRDAKGSAPVKDLAGTKDVRLMSRVIKQLRDRGDYPELHVTPLEDAKATPQAIVAKIAELGAAVRPDDWLVVFLSGHGDAEADEVKGGKKPGTWHYIGFDPGDFGKAILPSEKLFESLQSINCHKLVLLDCCHAGAAEASARSSARVMRPDDKGATVIAGAAADEKAAQYDIALDHPGGGKSVPEKAGYFTAALYHGLGAKVAAADRNRDGTLTLEELSAFADAEVQVLRARVNNQEFREKSQRVVIAPAPVAGGRFASAPAAPPDPGKK